MNTTKLSLMLFLAWMASGLLAQAQKEETRLFGRLLVDGAFWDRGADGVAQGEVSHGVLLRDVRLGATSAHGPWRAKVEAALTHNRLSLTDVFVSYDFAKNHSLRFGNALVPFGLLSMYGTLNKDYMEDPLPNVFQPYRRIGITHTYHTSALWLQYGLFADRMALRGPATGGVEPGWMSGGRLVWRPIVSDGLSLHGGVSGLYVRPELTPDRNARQVAYHSTYLTAVDGRKALSLLLPDAQHEAKGTAEALVLYKNLKLTSQLYYSNVWRKDHKCYATHGLYVIGAAQIFNPGNYVYNRAKSGANLPGPNSLELTLGYGYLNLRDKRGQESPLVGMEQAGVMQDFTLGLSYYCTKQVAIRANYHHFLIDAGATATALRHQNVLQARLQYRF